MPRQSKRFREIAKRYDPAKQYTIEQAIDILKSCPPVKFNQSVEVSLKTGIDARKSDQQVRGTVSLPNGTGKTMVIVVIAKGDKVKDALAHGADHAGSDDLLEKIKNGWTDFDALITTPDMMREVGKLGKVLGPRNLMPTPKAGTVTNDIVKAIQEMKAGKVEFKADKAGVVNNLVGKIAFEKDALVQNILAFLTALTRARPSTAKGQFLKGLVLSSTMGPGIRVNISSLPEF